MTEMQEALKVVHNLPKAQLIETTTGRWVYVGGGIPAHLALVRKDGQAATEQDYKNATIAGPSIAGMTQRSWSTKAEALEALA